MSSVKVPLEFTRLIERVGGDFHYTQGLGGNCSVKHRDRMLVKSSGKRLSAIKSPDYFHKVVLTDEGFEDSIAGQSTRPSIEVFLHADIQEKYVLHLHSLRSIATSMKLGDLNWPGSQLGDDSLAFVPYARPGRHLRDEIRKVRKNSPGVGAYILANHGILLCGDTILQIEERLSKLEALFDRVLGQEGALSIGPLDAYVTLSAAESEVVAWHAKQNWRISPDHVVFLGHEAPSNLLNRLNGSPRIVDLLGDFLHPDGSPSVKSEQLLAFINVALMLPRKNFSTLSQEESVVLANWDAEKERKMASQHEN